MSSNNRHKNLLNRESIRNYLSGFLTNTEKNRLERNAMLDPFDQEALEGLSELTLEEFDNDLKELSSKVMPQKKTRVIPLFLRVASIVLLIMIPTITIWYMVTFKPEEKGIGQVLEEKTDSLVNQQSSKERTAPNKRDSVTQPITGTTLKKKEYKSDNTNRIRDKKPLITKTTEKAEPKSEDSQLRKESLTDDMTIQPEELTVEESDHESTELRQMDEANGIAPAKVSTQENFQSPQKKLVGRSVVGKDKIKSGIISGTKIKGYVTDDHGEPLPGVTIHLKKSQQGTITNKEGEFTIVAEDSNDILEAQFIGFRTGEKKLKSQDSIVDIQLEPELMALDEVVATGYDNSKEVSSELMVVPPRPAMGFYKYKSYIEDHIHYPESGSGNREVVTVEITIDRNGGIKNVAILKSPGEDYSSEVIKAIKEGPEWEPSKRGTVPVEGKEKLRIVFKPN